MSARIYPTSFAQERLWVLDQVAGAATAYTVTLAVNLTGDLDEAALRSAMDAVVARHEALRTSFAVLGGQPVQVVHARAVPVLELIDLRDLAGDRVAAGRAALDEAARMPFDLGRAPLMRARLVRLGPGEQLFGLFLHHIVVDEWSAGLLLREIVERYTAGVEGAPDPAGPAPARYGDYAAWQRRTLTPEREAELTEFWLAELAGAPELLTLPTDRPRPAEQSFRGAWRVRELGAEAAAGVDRLAQAERATPFMVLVAGFAEVLGRYSGQKDVVLGTSVADRSRPEFDRTIGFFVNTLVLRTDLSGGCTFRELVGRVRAASLRAYQHQDLPFERVVAACRPPRTAAYQPLFQVMITMQQGGDAAVGTPGLTIAVLPPPEAAGAPFDLALSAVRTPGGLRLALQHRLDLFDPATADRILGHLVELLSGAVRRPDAPASRLPMVPAGERRVLVARPEAGRSRPWSGANVLDAVRRRAAETPDRVAVAGAGGSVTYAELIARCDRVAAELRTAGIGREDVVGLCCRRGPEFAAGMLAAWRMGAAFVPLSPQAPAPRLEYLVERAGCAAALVDEAGRTALAGLVSRLVPLEPGDEQDGGFADAVPDADSLAYVLFTSGTTGRPKGAMVAHAGMLNHLAAKIDDLGMTAADVLAQNGPVTFDVVVWQYCAPLVLGGRVHVVPDDVLADPVRFSADLERGGVTVLQAVPSVISLLLAEPAAGLGALRRLVPTGDALPADVVRRWFARYPRIPMLNTYGLTECSDDQYHAVLTGPESVEGTPIATIGRPVPGLYGYVLDAELAPCPPGVPGELFLGGIGIGRGYVGDPARTAERFVPDPFHPGRLYRTGDRVRRHAGGDLEFLGRADHQVKIRGFRVEPAEVAAALTEHPAVRDAVVVATGTPGEVRRLVGYAVVADPAVTGPALRGHLAERLPDYLVPGQVMLLDRLPVTANGKLDRDALPPPEPDLTDATAPPAGVPADAVADLVTALWGTILGSRRVDPDADFFAAGGNSLLAAQLLVRLRAAAGVKLSHAELLAEPTVDGISAAVRAALRAGPAVPVPVIVPLPRDRPLPASFAQQRLWVIEHLMPRPGRYTVPLTLRWRRTVPDEVLAGALADLTARHEILRTRLVERDGKPVQEIAAAVAVPVDTIDLAGHPDADRAARADLDAQARAGVPVDALPPLRVRVLRLAPDDLVVGLFLHHAATDAWSNGLLARDLIELVDARTAARPPRLPPVPVQYADFASWQREQLDGDRRADLLRYWVDRLAEAPELSTVPGDRPRPPAASGNGGREPVHLPAEAFEAVRRFAREHDATPFMVLLAALYAVLHRRSGQRDLVVGVPVAGRPHQDLLNCVGLFVNSLPLRVNLAGLADFRSLVGRVRQECLAGYAHADLPFEALVERLAPARTMAYNPVFQVALGLVGAGKTTLDDVLAYAVPDTGTAKFDLEFLLRESGDGVDGVLEYSLDLYTPATARRLAGDLLAVLAAGVAQPDLPLGRLPLLRPDEERVVASWASGPERHDPPATLTELVAAQVASTPDAVALRSGGEDWTYGRFWTAVRALAGRLGAAGAGPGEVVGVLAPRSAELVVAVHAVQLVGAAYLPLDPEQPAVRAAAMCRTAGIRVVVADSGAVLPLPELRRVEPIAEAGPESPERPSAAVPDSLAYAIFTSGSTGTPKGVGVSHRAAVNRLRWMQRLTPIGAGDRVLFKTPASFDVSVWELFWPLLAGATLVVAEPGAHRDPERLAELLVAEGITVVHAVPTLLGPLLDRIEAGPRPAALSTVVCSGEALPAWLVDRAARVLPGTQMLNLYGPTEAAVDVTWHRCVPGEAVVPIGRPADNVRLEVLDDEGYRVPVGAPGELHLGGVQLAHGYLAAPGRTAERFVPDPYRAGQRLYRTGDLARWRDDGTLEYLGRTDRQVKIRGYRVEPAEVESVLAAHPGVRDVAVVPRFGDGPARLAAYVVPVGDFPVAELRRHAVATLPAHLVPAWFVAVPALPTGTSGKLDVSALPAPAPAASAGYRPPGTERERMLADIWAAVLGLDRVGAEDNFFELGGDSIRCLAVVSRAARAGLRLTARAFFEEQTVAGLARVAEPIAPAADPARTGPADSRFPAGHIDEATFARVLATMRAGDQARGDDG